MDASLKERLIGAAVLVAIGVWVIPWILGGRAPQREETTSSLALPVPAQSASPIKTEVIELEDSAKPATMATTEPVPSTEAPLAEAPSKPSAAASSPEKPPATATTSAASKPVSAKPEASASRPPPPSASSGPAARPTAPAAETPAPAVVASGDWTVQLGSFGDAENAERLAERVRVLGFEAEVSTFRAGGRLMRRVRVGPQPTRERAEAVASALGAHGFVAQVVPAS